MEPKRNYTNINSNSLQSLITQICARSKSLLILLKIGVANSLEDATHRLSNILPMAFRTYSPRPFAHTPARNICGRSKLWCWRHRCTVRGSTLGAVYTSSNRCTIENYLKYCPQTSVNVRTCRRRTSYHCNNVPIYCRTKSDCLKEAAVDLSKDWSKIRGDTNHIIYRLYAIINNNYEILLIINKCLNDHKDKFRKLQTIYKQSLKRKEYSDLIYNTCNIKIKTSWGKIWKDW